MLRDERGKPERQSERDDESLATRERRRVAHVVGTVVVDHADAERILHLLKFVSRVELSDFDVCMLNEEAQRVALSYLA